LFVIVLTCYDYWVEICWYFIKHPSACILIIAVYDCFVEVVLIFSNQLFNCL
jgi:hypothetical protein